MPQVKASAGPSAMGRAGSELARALGRIMGAAAWGGTGTRASPVCTPADGRWRRRRRGGGGDAGSRNSVTEVIGGGVDWCRRLETPVPVAPPSPRPLLLTPAPPAPRRLQHRQHRSLAAPPRAGSRLHSRRGDGGSEPASPAGEARAGRWGSVGRRLAFSDLFLVRDDRSSHNFAILLIDFAALYARY